MPKRKYGSAFKGRSGRTVGYRYARRADGTKYRVYGGAARRGSRPKRYAIDVARRYKTRRYATTPKNRGASGRVDYFGDTIMGVGSYRRSRGGSKILGGDPPTVQNSKQGFIVRHREYIGDLNTSQAFQNYVFDLNPGIATTFPWLCEVASNFEEWVPRGIIFEFKSTSSDSVVSNNANAALGTVIMATEYNPYNGAFANKQQMENYEWAKSCKPSQSMMHGVECSKNQNPMGSYFVRTGAVPLSQDKRLYDIGSFQIAAAGMQSNGAACGELWCSYEIELRKPRIQVGESINNQPGADHFTLTAIAGGVDTTITPARPFGTITSALRVPNDGSNLKGYASGGIVAASAQPLGGVIPVLDANGNTTGAFGASSANTYYFNAGITRGKFLVTYTANYTTGGTASWAPVFTFTNCDSDPDLFTNQTESEVHNVGTGGVTRIFVCQCIEVLKPNAFFTLVGTVGAFATPVSADLFIQAIPSGLL